jgi:hypothetical protein
MKRPGFGPKVTHSPSVIDYSYDLNHADTTAPVSDLDGAPRLSGIALRACPRPHTPALPSPRRAPEIRPGFAGGCVDRRRRLHTEYAGRRLAERGIPPGGAYSCA